MDNTSRLEKIKIVLISILVVVFSITAGLSLHRLTTQALKSSSNASTKKKLVIPKEFITPQVTKRDINL